MKRVTQAIGALVVETCGVVLTLSLLFGGVLWSLEAPTPQAAAGATLSDALAWRTTWTSLTDRVEIWLDPSDRVRDML
jgi:hypothetical protein